MSVEVFRRSGRAMLIASLGLNVLLAVFLAAMPRTTALRGGAPTELAAVSAPAATNLPAAVAELPAVYATNRFHWRALECDDYERFVANLRAVGCPEKTIGDIIRADVQKLYALKIAAVARSGSFWASGPARERSEQAAEQEKRRLEREQTELLARLLGPAASQGAWAYDDFTEVAVLLFLLGPLPESLPERVLGELASGEERVSHAEGEYSHSPVAVEELQVRQVRQECLANVRTLLTDSQFQEFMLRLCAVTMIDDYLDEFKPTTAELRGLAAIYFEVFGASDKLPFNLFNSSDRADADEQRFRDRVRVFLGETRYAQLREHGKGFSE